MKKETALFKLIKNAGRALDGLIFPNTGACIYCGREGADNLCPDCADKLEALTLNARRLTGGYLTYSKYAYADIVSGAIIKFKFNNHKWLSAFLYQDLLTCVPNAQFDVVTAVPLYKRRLKKRGYNQSELLARKIANKLSLPYENLLTRTRNTKSQSKLPASKRLTNVAGAFCAIDPQHIKEKRILVIDDVITTGSTIQECMKELYGAGAALVIGASYAAAE
jgi:competence protein ComFC